MQKIFLHSLKLPPKVFEFAGKYYALQNYYYNNQAQNHQLGIVDIIVKQCKRLS